MNIKLCTVPFLGRSPSDVYSLLIKEIFSRIFIGKAAKFDYQRTFVHNIESQAAIPAYGVEFKN